MTGSESEPEAVRRLRRVHAAYAKGDFEAAMEGVHPDIEFLPAGGQSPIRGAAAYREWMEPDAIRQDVEILDVQIAGNRVLVHQRTKVHGISSGIEQQFEPWSVFTLDDDDRTIRHQIFLDHEEDEARRAAGLGQELK